ncbi:glycosyltransferase [Paucibacter sp. O1-1]|nr:glycosyltransferase [Paucibacter sp. O1-1]MDA3831005.1 glycosyltransferase [Paucibacter sp. O1-1]
MRRPECAGLRRRGGQRCEYRRDRRASRRGRRPRADAPFQLGAWGAAQAGMRFALRNGYHSVITLDADGQHHPEQLPILFEAHASGNADVTIGTCPGRLSGAKRIAWAYFRLITGLHVTDFTSGLRIYGRRAIRVLASREASLIDYQDIGVLILLRRKALVIQETPTVMSPRRDGGSRIFSSWLTVARYMIATTVLSIARVGARGPIRQRATEATS